MAYRVDRRAGALAGWPVQLLQSRPVLREDRRASGLGGVVEGCEFLCRKTGFAKRDKGLRPKVSTCLGRGTGQ